MSRLVSLAVAGWLLPAPRAAAQDTPYFVAYSHHLEEPGSLELEFFSTYGTQHRGNDFVAPWLELEYGATAWWTTELYLDTQSTFNDRSLYTGFRWENRFRPLMREHWINPVLYVEYENTDEADKTIKEVVGFDSAADSAVPNGVARRKIDREAETKLILSSDYKGWNISENFIGEKNLGHAPWEFGYAAGLSRPLRLASTARPCRFCRENFVAGVEFYGGLGTTQHLTLSHTSHYAAHRERSHDDRGVLAAIAQAPAKTRDWKNPYEGQLDAALAGEKLYRRHCAECHGDDARGRRSAPNLRAGEVQNAADGELVWFLANGNLAHGMPSWSGLPVERRWQIVTYLRTLR